MKSMNRANEKSAPSDSGIVTFRFYEELNDFLPASLRKRDFPHHFCPGQTVKDAIEAHGVVHAEVDLILVNGESVDFGYRLCHGDRISVYPMFESLDIFPVSKVRREPLRTPAFILDVHLGKLARRLRILGFDTLYRNDYTDRQIVDHAGREKRIILTRDRGLLQHRKVLRGRWLRTTAVEEQVREVMQRFDLFRLIRPYSRCPHCNDILERVAKKKIENELPPGTRKQVDTFSQCPKCQRIYWQGAHTPGINGWLRRLGIED